MWCRCVFNYLVLHKATVMGTTFLLVTSAIKSLPTPGDKFQWYPFLYDWSHSFFHLNNPREFPQGVPLNPKA